MVLAVEKCGGVDKIEGLQVTPSSPSVVFDTDTKYHIPYAMYHIPYTIYHIPYTIYHVPYTIYHIPGPQPC
jgi:hypothetical protein